MIFSLSFSKYNTYKQCPLKYWFQYVIKPDIKRELSYALVLGQLVHLFINLFYDKNYTKNELKKLKNNEKELHNYLTECSYLSFNFKSKSYEVITTNFDTDIISFIEEKEVVYWHALKLFNKYIENVHKKIITYKPDEILTEFTFNNIINVDNHTICLYGAIDNLFVYNNKKLIYICDIKTGKNYYYYYLNQLYFYYFNLSYYDFHNKNKFIKNNIDNIKLTKKIRNYINDGKYNVYGLLFMIGFDDFDYKRKKISTSNINYWKFINFMFDDINKMIELSKRKRDDVKNIVSDYNSYYNYIELQKNENIPVSYNCKFCDYAKNKLCNFRLKQDNE